MTLRAFSTSAWLPLTKTGISSPYVLLQLVSVWLVAGSALNQFAG